MERHRLVVLALEEQGLDWSGGSVLHFAPEPAMEAVSYTHLDVYKRQTWSCGSFFTNPVLTSAEFAELTDRVGARLGAEVVPPGFPAADSTVKTLSLIHI